MNFLIKYSPGRILGLFLLISVLSLSNGPAVLAVWQEPTQDPPGGNRPVPLDVSATAQTKAGGLTIQGAAATVRYRLTSARLPRLRRAA